MLIPLFWTVRFRGAKKRNDAVNTVNNWSGVKNPSDIETELQLVFSATEREGDWPLKVAAPFADLAHAIGLFLLCREILIGSVCLFLSI